MVAISNAVCNGPWPYNAVKGKIVAGAVGKETGQTYKIERFNATLRQRVARLVRKALSFSKTLENHIGAIWYFVHHYNQTLSAAG